MESGSGPQSPSPGSGPGAAGHEPDEDQKRPQSPSSPQSPGGLQAPGYGGPTPPGGWEQPLPSSGPAAHGGELAGWGRRLAATILDGLIIGIPALVIMGVLGIGVVGASSTDSGFALVLSIVVALLVSVLVVVVITFIYAPTTMMRSGEHNGQTFGKQMAGIRVVRTSGEPMDFLWATLREVLIKNFGVGILSSVTLGIAFLANYLWPLFDDENRALHDFLAQTRVVSA